MRWELRGAHVHVSLFVGKSYMSLRRYGELVFREEEWEVFKRQIKTIEQGGVTEILAEGERSVFD